MLLWTLNLQLLHVSSGETATGADAATGLALGTLGNIADSATGADAAGLGLTATDTSSGVDLCALLGLTPPGDASTAIEALGGSIDLSPQTETGSVAEMARLSTAASTGR